MKKLLSILLLISAISLVGCAEKGNEPIVLIKTKFGNMKVRLFNGTPAHRDNFLKLVDEGIIDSTLFHRVIDGFMIQGGDPDSKNAKQGAPLGKGGPGYTIPAEIDYPKHFHKKGALSAARQGDRVNPEKRSSGSQFYIVQGEIIEDDELVQIENRGKDQQRRKIFNELLEQYNDSLDALQRANKQAEVMQLQQKIMAEVNVIYEQQTPYEMPSEVKEAYKTIGGTPRLDDSYTVFGQLIEDKTLFEKVQSLFGKKFGFEVLDAIAAQECDGRDRPIEDIQMRVKVLKR
ncbi:peptidylprolyl isomerase [Saccharicrinis aurantiacus]|uniref:peptidylprolyl isomerase n=1 Tax=Saccharicrinis aurantiacus TaxID=1849719 RepID=UPI0024921D48|nr:peptidylprolyl isomerase [Saccharicrinis aurantiacus]